MGSQRIPGKMKPFYSTISFAFLLVSLAAPLHAETGPKVNISYPELDTKC